MSNFKNLREYFSSAKTFVVPYYQRGYKWSLQINKKRGDLHIRLLLRDFKREFLIYSQRDKKSAYKFEYPIQGITLKETIDQIELVDGQQRTTTLFILFCVLKNRNVSLDFNLENKFKYNVREAANNTIQGFINGICEGDDSIQDIAALKKAWNICHEEIASIENLALFAEFLQENIKIIYIKLDEHQDETKVFSMMNKDKAEMSQTDLVKSNLLREASRQVYGEMNSNSSDEGLEWQINLLRSKLAIEWDNWRKWWENDDRLSFCKFLGLSPSAKDTEPNMAVLLRLHMRYFGNNAKSISSNGLFEYFKDQISDKDEEKIEALEVFETLRLLQNILDEWYHNCTIYNYLGLLFKGCGLNEKEKKLMEILKKYIKDKNNFTKDLKKEYIDEILEGSSKDDFLNSIIEDINAYHLKYTIVARQLLRMNVVRADKQKQKFNFSLYEEENNKEISEIDTRDRRSLEHIKPQTYYNDSISKETLEVLEKMTNRIGNLVLVPRGLNSSLSNKPFKTKKEIVFKNMLSTEGKNIGLWLHTLEIFGSNSEWLIQEIKNNTEKFETEFNSFFK